MAAFRFPLQKVLEHREEEERQSALSLAHARREAERARRALQDLHAAQAAGRAELAAAHGAGGSVGHLQNLAFVVERLEGQIRKVNSQCRKAEAEVGRSMECYRAASRERLRIDQLRTRRLEQWRTQEAQSEQKAMDEVALTRHQRAGSSKEREEG
ncbi:MAG: flagellar export protein FliJ [Gemmatimonadota bacterium]